jgi:hypothetical protein
MVETVNVRCKLAMFSNLLVIVKSGKGHNFFFRKYTLPDHSVPHWIVLFCLLKWSQLPTKKNFQMVEIGSQNNQCSLLNIISYKKGVAKK